MSNPLYSYPVPDFQKDGQGVLCTNRKCGFPWHGLPRKRYFDNEILCPGSHLFDGRGEYIGNTATQIGGVEER